MLASGKLVIGEDKPSQPLFAETLPAVEAADPLGLVESIVAVHRLQAVTCLYGFTRLEPAPTIQDQQLEDVRIATEGAPLSEHADWLPAMEQKGDFRIQIQNRVLQRAIAPSRVQDIVCENAPRPP